MARRKRAFGKVSEVRTRSIAPSKRRIKRIDNTEARSVGPRCPIGIRTLYPELN